jgi:POT family proton-dependent oligopeptide transporter
MATTEKMTHPRGLYSLFFTEMWERFSYYGMRALLVLYLTTEYAKGGFGFERASALEIYGIFTGLVYLTPIVGGMLADKILGQRRAIYTGGVLMALGQFALAASHIYMADAGQREFLFYMGLGLLMVGNGFFKPNISTIVGTLYEDNDPRKDSAFTIFYMGINLGAFLAPIICGTLGEQVGWKWGFGSAGVGMLLACIWFYFEETKLEGQGMPPGRTGEARLVGKDFGVIAGYIAASFAVVYGFLALQAAISESAMSTIIQVVGVIGLLGLAYVIYNGTSGSEQWSRVGAILIFAVANIFFWSGFEQAGGTFNLFAAEETNRTFFINESTIYNIRALLFLGLGIGLYYIFNAFQKAESKGKRNLWFVAVILAVITWRLSVIPKEGEYEVAASLFQSINALAIFIFAPVFASFWVTLATRNRNPSTPAKFGLGLALLSLGFVVMSLASFAAEGDALVSPLWLVGVYVLHTFGELCLSPIGLSMITKLAPPKIVSVMMGLWFASMALANYMAGIMESLLEKIFPGMNLFVFLTITAAAGALLMFALTPLLRKLMKGIH